MPLRPLTAGGLWTAAYWLAALIGLQWGTLGSAGSPVWPAAGVGIAALLLGGMRFWPSIVLGRLAAAWMMGSAHPLTVELVIAAGNAVSTVAAVWLMRSIGRIDVRLNTMRDVIWLAIGSVAAAAMAAATGTGALWLTTGIGWEGAAALVGNWFMGNSAGTLTVAPLILAWAGREQWRLTSSEWLHLSAIVVLTSLTSALVFLGFGEPYLRTWHIFPALIWAALAFQIRGAAVALCIVSVLAIYSATIDVGPLAVVLTTTSVFISQQFVTMISIAILILAAVADERRGQEALRASEERFRLLVDGVRDHAIVMLAADGRVATWNAGAERLMGWSADAVVGQQLTAFLPEKDGVVRRLAELKDAGSPVSGYGETRWRRSDGSEFIAELTVTALRDEAGRLRGFAMVTQDVTERRAAQAALLESEARLRAIVETAPDAIVVIDEEGAIQSVNPATERIFGYTTAELIGGNSRALLSSADRDQGLPRIAGRGQELEAKRKDGTTFPVDLSIAEWRDARGQRFFTEIMHDISARKAAESALQELNADLERRIAEGAARVVHLQKMESLGQLTGGIAHDFNNLIMTVIGSLELLRRHLSPDDARALRLIDNALLGAQRGASLTQRMLAFARQQELRLEPVRVTDLVTGMKDLLKQSVGAQVRIEMHLAPAIQPALADANQLELAILNLAVNGRDAMNGEGKLQISVDEIELGAGAGMAAGSYVRLRIADTGEGMDEQTLRRATDPFFTTKGVGKGTGLGLSTVEGLAAQSGGRFSLTSKLGEGTTAEILLRVAPEGPQRSPATDSCA